MELEFGELPSGLFYSGECKVYQGAPPVSIEEPSIQLIQGTKPWFVHIEWSEVGWMSKMSGGTLETRLHLEHLGGGDDFDFGTETTVQDLTTSTQETHQVDIVIPANTRLLLKEGVYKIITQLLLKRSDGIIVSAFAEGLVRLY